nr:cation:proton antiporter [Patulibacter sp. SYSU D01012]
MPDAPGGRAAAGWREPAAGIRAPVPPLPAALSTPIAPLASEPGFHPGEIGVLVYLLAGIGVLVATVALSNQGGRTYTSALVYLGVGLLAAVAIPLVGGTPLDPIADASVVEHLTEVAVIIALFGTGLAVDRPLHWRAWTHAARLLLVAMPLTIAAIAVFGATAMGLSLGAAIVLGAAVSPTDPVLAGDLGIGPPGEPDDEDASFALTAEAGFNDGLAFPFIMAGLLVAHHGDDGGVLTWAAADVLWGLGLGVVVGGTLGWGAAALVRRIRDRGYMREYFDAWVSLGVVLTVYGVTEVVDAYGFVAAFVAGIGFRAYERGHEMHEGAHRGASVFERFGELAVVLLVASSLTFDGLAVPGVSGWVLIALVVLVIRPAAGLIGLIGTRMPLRERAFVAFFGVRGVGSLYYASFVVGAAVLPREEAATVLWTVVGLAVVSIVVHGLASEPARRRLQRRSTGAPGSLGAASAD